MFLSWSVRIKDTVDSVGLIPRLPFTRCPTFKSIKGHEMSRSKGITATYTDMIYINLNARFRFRQVDLMWFAWFAGLSSWFWVMNLLNAVPYWHWVCEQISVVVEYVGALIAWCFITWTSTGGCWYGSDRSCDISQRSALLSNNYYVWNGQSTGHQDKYTIALL